MISKIYYFKSLRKSFQKVAIHFLAYLVQVRLISGSSTLFAYGTLRPEDLVFIDISCLQ